MENFGFKSFENVKLKATYNMEIGNRKIQKGEVIVLFDKIQIASFDERIERISANGGFDNRPRVFWESTREEEINFSQGIFNKEQLSLLFNSKIIEKGEENPVLLSKREYLESDEEGKFELKELPVENLFIYKKEDYSKLEYSIEDKVVTISKPFTEVVVDYMYIYKNNADLLLLGAKYLSGFLELEGTTHVKDDTTGKIVTGVIRVPHLKLTSGLSIRLGALANPIVGNFSGIGVPVGNRGSSYISEFYLLDDDVDSDL